MPERKRASTKASVDSSTAATGPDCRSSCKRAKDLSALKVLVVTWAWEDPSPTLRTAARLLKKMDAELHVAYV